jgi:hypothetical protein
VANARLFALGLLVLALSGGCSLFRLEAPTPAVAAQALYATSTPYAALHVLKDSARNPLLLRETRLAGLALGLGALQVKAVAGEPAKIYSNAQGQWWEYPSYGLRLVFKGAQLAQIQAWSPSQAETSTLVRPLDQAVRVLRKYGKPFRQVAWGDSSAWIYPAADLAFVLTPEAKDGNRSVAGIIVGL